MAKSSAVLTPGSSKRADRTIFCRHRLGRPNIVSYGVKFKFWPDANSEGERLFRKILLFAEFATAKRPQKYRDISPYRDNLKQMSHRL